MLNMVILVLLIHPVTAQYRMAEVALPPGTMLVTCEGASAQVYAMRDAEQATGWRAVAARCSARGRS